VLVLSYAAELVQGELISESGTMTGGGTSVRTGKMQLGNAPPVTMDPTQMQADLAAAEHCCRQAEVELQRAQAAMAQHLAAAEAAEQDARHAESQLQKRQAEAESAALLVAQLERQVIDEQCAAEVPCHLSASSHMPF
jgi:chromosome segregation ATPase